MKSKTLDIVAEFPTLQLVSEVRPEVCILYVNFCQFGCALVSLFKDDMWFLTLFTSFHVRDVKPVMLAKSHVIFQQG